MLTPAQVAKRANVSVGTIRNWSRDYADLLSPQARAGSTARLFTEEDVQVLCAIADLRKSGVPPSEIADHIQRGDVVVDVAPQQSPQQPRNAPQEVPEASKALQLVASTLQGQIDALQRSQRAQLRQQLWSHGVAFYLGMVTMGAIFFFVWMLVNGF